MKHDRLFSITTVCFIVLGMAGVVALSRRMDRSRPVLDASEEEQLYVNAETAKRVSLGFNGLIADWYWLRSLQYVGHKIIDSRAPIQLDNLGPLNLKLLAPLLETSTTLDPQFLAPYEYAAVVLPAVDKTAAVRITRKGIASNPQVWKLYHGLGFIYWEQQNFQAASEIYGEGAAIPGAPPWMSVMHAQLAAQGGSRNTALEIYLRLYQDSGDPSLKEMARRRILQVQSLNERDAIRNILSEYSTRAGRCASSWQEVSDALRKARLRINASGAPIDPEESPYQLAKTGCDVDLDPVSRILRDRT